MTTGRSAEYTVTCSSKREMCQFKRKDQCHGGWEFDDKESLTKKNAGGLLGQHKLVNRNDIQFSQNILLPAEARFTLGKPLTNLCFSFTTPAFPYIPTVIDLMWPLCIIRETVSTL